MPAASEIDDIFSVKASTSAAASVIEPKEAEKQSDKKKKKRKAEKIEPDRNEGGSKSTSGLIPSEETSKTKKRKSKSMAETVFDPSKVIEAKVAAKKIKASSVSKKKLTEDEEDFMNTRGKNRRKTEDGFLIYKADELKIDIESGGTPLCPFDCDCCH